MKDDDLFEHLPLDPIAHRSRRARRSGLRRCGEQTVLEARARGGGIDGLEILVRQGAESLHIWTGMDRRLDVMREAAKRGGETDA